MNPVDRQNVTYSCHDNPLAAGTFPIDEDPLLTAVRVPLALFSLGGEFCQGDQSTGIEIRQLGSQTALGGASVALRGALVRIYSRDSEGEKKLITSARFKGDNIEISDAGGRTLAILINEMGGFRCKPGQRPNWLPEAPLNGWAFDAMPLKLIYTGVFPSGSEAWSLTPGEDELPSATMRSRTIALMTHLSASCADEEHVRQGLLDWEGRVHRAGPVDIPPRARLVRRGGLQSVLRLAVHAERQNASDSAAVLAVAVLAYVHSVPWEYRKSGCPSPSRPLLSRLARLGCCCQTSEDARPSGADPRSASSIHTNPSAHPGPGDNDDAARKQPDARDPSADGGGSRRRSGGSQASPGGAPPSRRRGSRARRSKERASKARVTRERPSTERIPARRASRGDGGRQRSPEPDSATTRQLRGDRPGGGAVPSGAPAREIPTMDSIQSEKAC